MKRNKFNLSHYRLTTLDMGHLVPLTWYEALPGDSIQHSTSALVRLSPMMAPVMHPCRVRIHHFFVPNRLLWDDWEDFITGGPEGTSYPVFPFIRLAEKGSTITNSSLYDYLGIPPGNYVTNNIDVSVLPFRAYSLIYNHFYRDQDLCLERPISTLSGKDSTTTTSVSKVSWSKDYFTTARPWESKGPDILVPLSGSAPVTGIGKMQSGYTSSNVDVYETGQGGDTVNYDYASKVSSTDPETFFVKQFPHLDDIGPPPVWSYPPDVHADLSQATGMTVNDLRLSLALQRAQEARAQYGSRYVEYLRYLGVRSSDSRLQLPEYLGGGRQVIQFSEVLQTSPGVDSSVGEMRGHGISAMKTNRFRRFFEEHGIVMSLMSVVPKSIYSSSLPKCWRRRTKEDYFQKELQFIGDQPVSNFEINALQVNHDEIFGYQSRYNEYRTIPSGIAGDFRGDLNHWHLAREFSGDVALNSSFVDCTPSKRIFADTVAPALLVQSNHSVRARRMLTAHASTKTF